MLRQTIEFSTISGMVHVGTFGAGIPITDEKERGCFTFDIDQGGITAHKEGGMSQIIVGAQRETSSGLFTYTTTTHLKPGDERSLTWTETFVTRTLPKGKDEAASS